MATKTKTIGTLAGRDYSLVTTWKDDLDSAVIYAPLDIAIGDMYNDSPFDEGLVLDTGVTTGLSKITLQAALGHRHTGIANTGVRVVKTTDLKSWSVFYQNGTGLSQVSIAFVELNQNGFSLSGGSWTGVVYSRQAMSRGQRHVSNLLIHGERGKLFEAVGIFPRGMDVYNCVVYDIKRVVTTNPSLLPYGIKTNKESFILNCTVHNIVGAVGSNQNAIGIQTQIAGSEVRNCISMDVLADGTGTALDLSLHASTIVNNNMSSDTSATGTGSLISKTALAQFVSIVPGSENYHLLNAADAKDAGVILGSTPAGVEVAMPDEGFLDGLDRVINAQGPTWDIGAYEFLAINGGDPGILPLSITDDMTKLSDADSALNWNAGNDTSSPTADTVIKVQGTAAMSCRVNGTTLPSGLMYDLGVDTDLSSKHLYVWGFTMHSVESKANGGWRIRVSSDPLGLSDYGEWYVSGKDVFIGANANFQSLVVDTTKPFDATNGIVPALNLIRSVGVISKFLTSNGKLSFYADDLKYGTGITIKDGTVAIPGTFKDVAIEDKTLGRGVITDVGGIFYVSGSLTIGNATIGGHDFVDSDFIVVFEDMEVNPSHNQLNLVGNPSGFGRAIFGSLVGSGTTLFGTGGGTFKSLGPRFAVNVTNASLNNPWFFGTSFLGAGQINFSAASSRAISCNFSGCDTIILSAGVEFKRNNISNAVNSGIQILSNLGTVDMRDIVIQSCPIAITVDASIPGNLLELENFQFIGNISDLEVTGTGTFTVVTTKGGITPKNILTPQGAIVTLNNLVNFNLTTLIPGSQIYIAATVGGPLVTGSVIFGPVIEPSDNYLVSFDYSSDQPIRGIIALGTSAPFYKPYAFTGTITASGFTLSIAQELDQ